MSSVKDLISAIINGEDYSDAFKRAVSEKINERLDQERERIAQNVFASNLDEDSVAEPMKKKPKAAPKKIKHPDTEKWETTPNPDMKDVQTPKQAMKEDLDERYETGKVDYVKGENNEGKAEKSSMRYSDYANGLRAKRKKEMHKKKHEMKDSLDLEDVDTLAEDQADATKSVSKLMDKHIKSYLEGGMDADTLGEHTVKAHSAIAKKHGMSHKEAVACVNNYVDEKLG